MARRSTPLPQPRQIADLPLSAFEDELARRRAQRPRDDAPVALPPRMPMRDFMPGAWRVLEGRRPYLANWHIDAKCEFLQAVSDGQITKLVINEPPGMAKSLVSSAIWPAWDWGPNDRPERRYLCLSFGGDSGAPSMRDADRMRQLIDSDWYQQGWGTRFQLSETQNAKNYFANTKRGHRVSTGIDGTASGQRADIVLIDDPTKLDEDSIDAIQRPAEVYERTLSHRAIDDGSAIVLVMQRLHEIDMSGYFLKQDGWVHLRLPMFYEQAHKCRVFLNGKLFFEDPRTIDGQPLHERMNTAIEKARIQSISRPDIYSGQQQQRPQALEGGIIKTSWIRRYDAIPAIIDEVIITVDCAFKDGEKNSWVVGQVWGRRETNAYLLDQYRKHLDLPGTIQMVKMLAAKWPMAHAKYVEDKANGAALIQMIKNDVPGMIDTTSDDEGALCLKTFCSQSKEAKLGSVAPFFLAGNVHIPSHALDADGQEWVPEYIHELTTFPKSMFDDQVDATSMAVWKLLSSFTIHLNLTELLAQEAAAGRSVQERAYAETPDVQHSGGRGMLSDLSWGGSDPSWTNAYRRR